MGAVGGSTLRSGQPVTVVLTNQWIWTVCVASTCSSDAHWYFIHFPLPTRGPAGKNSGVVKGVKYFQVQGQAWYVCPKRQDHRPVLFSSSWQTRPPSGKSPLSQQRVASNPDFLGRPTISSSSRRSSGGGRLQFPKV